MGLVVAWLVVTSPPGGVSSAWADIIELTNGQRIEGIVVDVGDSDVLVRVGEQELRIRQAEVQAISIEGPRPSPAPAVTPAAPAATMAAPAVTPATAAAPTVTPVAPSEPRRPAALPPPLAKAPESASAASGQTPAPATPPTTSPRAEEESTAPAATPASPSGGAGGASPPPSRPRTSTLAPPGPAAGSAPSPITSAPLSPKVATALAALERLQASTDTALAPADYTARIEAVKREVEPALDETSSAAEVRTALGAAVRYHAMAALAKSVFEARGDLAAIGRNPVVASCRPLAEQVERDARELRLDPSDPTVVGLLAATEGAPALRTCAGEQIAEAERRARAVR